MALGGMRKSWLSWASWRWRFQKLGAGKKPAVGPVTATGSSLGRPVPRSQPFTPADRSAFHPAGPQLSVAPLGTSFTLGSEAEAPCCLGILAEPEEGHASLWGTLIFLLWQALDFCMPDVLKFHCVRGSRRLGTSSVPRPLVLPSCSSPSLLELISTIKPFTATCFPHGFTSPGLSRPQTASSNSFLLGVYSHFWAVGACPVEAAVPPALCATPPTHNPCPGFCSPASFLCCA